MCFRKAQRGVLNGPSRRLVVTASERCQKSVIAVHGGVYVGADHGSDGDGERERGDPKRERGMP